MTPQDLVRSRYPRAELQHRNAIFANGQQESHQPAEWVVYASGGLGDSVLGKGNSEEEAWANAAASVKDKSKKNMPGFREWLAKEAERERDSANQAKVIEEWTDSVLDLFTQMIRWLAEDDTEKLFLVETGKLKKDEQGLGAYEVAAIRFSLSSRHVDLIPIGRNIVGGIGKHGDIGFRSEGRVDMTNGADKYLLYRVVTEEGKEWMIVDDVNYEIRRLTRTAFEEALQDLLS